MKKQAKAIVALITILSLAVMLSINVACNGRSINSFGKGFVSEPPDTDNGGGTKPGDDVEPPIVGPEDPPADGEKVMLSVLDPDGGFIENHGFSVETIDKGDSVLEVVVTTKKTESREKLFVEIGFDTDELSYKSAKYEGLLGQQELVVTLAVPHEGGVALGAVRRNYNVMGGCDRSGDAWRIVLEPKQVAHITHRTPNPMLNPLPDLALAFNEDEPKLRFTAQNLGDFNLDGRVTILDIDPIAANFGVVKNQTGYDIRLDYDTSGKIGVLDLAPIVQNFGGELGSYNVYAGDTESTPQANMHIGGNPTVAGVKNGDSIAIQLDGSIDYGDYYHIVPVDLSLVEGEGTKVKYDLPFPPRDLTAIRTANGIECSWTPPPQEVYAYNFYYSRISGDVSPVRGNLAPIPATATQWTYTNADPGFTYYVRMAAVAEDGRESAMSREVALTVLEEEWRTDLGDLGDPISWIVPVLIDQDTVAFEVYYPGSQICYVYDSQTGEKRWSSPFFSGGIMLGDQIWGYETGSLTLKDKYDGSTVNSRPGVVPVYFFEFSGNVYVHGTFDSTAENHVFSQDDLSDNFTMSSSGFDFEYTQPRAGEAWAYDDGYTIYDFSHSPIKIFSVGSSARDYEPGIPYFDGKTLGWYRTKSVPEEWALELHTADSEWGLIGSYTDEELKPHPQSRCYVEGDQLIAFGIPGSNPLQTYCFDRDTLDLNYTRLIGDVWTSGTLDRIQMFDGRFYACGDEVFQYDAATGSLERSFDVPGNGYILGLSGGVMVVLCEDENNIGTLIGYRLKNNSTPNVPTGLTAIPGETDVELQWDAIAGERDTRFRVRFREAGTSEWYYSDMLPLSTTEYRASWLTQDQEYEFQVQCVDEGGVFGAFCASQFATPQATVVPNPGDVLWEWKYSNDGYRAIDNFDCFAKCGDLYIVGVSENAAIDLTYFAFTTDSNTPEWTKTFADVDGYYGNSNVRADDTNIFLDDGEGSLYCLNPDGSEAWNQPIGGPYEFYLSENYVFVIHASWYLDQKNDYVFQKSDGQVVQIKQVTYTNPRFMSGSDCLFVQEEENSDYTLTAYDKDLNELWSLPDRLLAGYIDGKLWMKDAIDNLEFFECDPLTGGEGRNCIIGSYTGFVNCNNLLLGYSNYSIKAIRKSDLGEEWTFNVNSDFGTFDSTFAIGSANVVNIGNDSYQFYLSQSQGEQQELTGFRNLCEIEPPMINDCALVGSNNTLYCIYVG
jgi:hypothetical protein